MQSGTSTLGFHVFLRLQVTVRTQEHKVGAADLLQNLGKSSSRQPATALRAHPPTIPISLVLILQLCNRPSSAVRLAASFQTQGYRCMQEHSCCRHLFVKAQSQSGCRVTSFEDGCVACGNTVEGRRLSCSRMPRVSAEEPAKTALEAVRFQRVNPSKLTICQKRSLLIRSLNAFTSS